MSWYFQVLKKYAVFSGRAGRKEYWYFSLFFCINYYIVVLIGFVLGSSVPIIYILYIYCLAILLPATAVSIRRLHDTGRSGWWLFTGLVPIIGEIIILIFLVGDSQEGTNQYGPSPKLVE